MEISIFLPYSNYIYIYIGTHTAFHPPPPMSAVPHIDHTSRVKLQWLSKSGSCVVTGEGAVAAHKLCIVLKTGIDECSWILHS